MRLTTYASAASCRHMMVLPWKHKSYFPTSRAISWTNCEKGSFLIRSSVLFWNCQISQRATVPGQYFLVFFTFPAWRNSFWGALPPMVDQTFLLAGSSTPDVDGLASAAICTNCQVGNDDGDLSTSSSLLASSIPLLSLLHLLLSLLHLLLNLLHLLLSLLSCGCGWGWVVNWRGGLISFSARALLASLEWRNPPLLTSLVFLGHEFPTCHTVKQFRKHQPMEKQHDFILVRFCLVTILNFINR